MSLIPGQYPPPLLTLGESVQRRRPPLSPKNPKKNFENPSLNPQNSKNQNLGICDSISGSFYGFRFKRKPTLTLLWVYPYPPGVFTHLLDSL